VSEVKRTLVKLIAVVYAHGRRENSTRIVPFG
jgi:hypothetical protein